MFASEYGWSAADVMAMPPDQMQELKHAILVRRGWKVVRQAAGPLPEATGSLFEKSRQIFDTEVTK